MNQSGFLLLAPDIPQGSIIPDRFSETNKRSPALEWEGVPEGTQSFALSITDPDLPPEFEFPRSFAHWLVYNIPGDARSLKEGASMTSAMPSGSQELNPDFVTFGIPASGAAMADHGRPTGRTATSSRSTRSRRGRSTCRPMPTFPLSRRRSCP